MPTPYNEMQLDALRELANIGSGTAATALSQMLGQEVELQVPRALALPLADAVDAAGKPESVVTAVVLPLEGDIEAIVLLLIPAADAQTLCQLLGVEAGTDVGDSALGEIGNILGTSYLNALVSMTGLELLPCPPELNTDLLAAIVASLLAQTAGETDTALLLDSDLQLADQACSLSFMLIATSSERQRAAGAVGTRRERWLAMASVRMGELVVSKTASDEIVAIGLGSCIGLALIDRIAKVAGLAHIVLPDSQGMAGPAAKFADVPCPSWSLQMQKSGANKSRLEAALVGGARMFALGSGLDIGARNEAAVRDALAHLQVRIHATATGGNRGRTVRVGVGDGHGQRAGGRRRAGGAASAPGPPVVRFALGAIGSATMSEILSPEQIAALVEAAKQGQLPEQSQPGPRAAAIGCGPSTSPVQPSSPATTSAGSSARSRPSA